MSSALSWARFVSTCLKNHFVLTTADPGSSAGFDQYPMEHIPGHIEPVAHVKLRSISVSLDVQKSMLPAHHSSGEPADFHFYRDSEELKDPMLRYHNVLSIDIYDALCSIMQCLFMSSIQLHGLRQLQINVQNAACALGCHRMVNLLFDDEGTEFSIRQFASKAKTIESLDFLGTVNDKERQVIRSAFPRSIRKKITFHGQFDSDEWRWDCKVEVIDEMPREHDASGSASKDSSSEDSSSE